MAGNGPNTGDLMHATLAAWSLVPLARALVYCCHTPPRKQAVSQLGV